jgi:hypothetical protein
MVIRRLRVAVLAATVAVDAAWGVGASAELPQMAPCPTVTGTSAFDGGGGRRRRRCLLGPGAGSSLGAALP